MFSASDLKKGLKIEIDGMPWVITEFDFCKPGKGTALYRCRMRNLVNGSGMEKTYRPDRQDRQAESRRARNVLLLLRRAPLHFQRPEHL